MTEQERADAELEILWLLAEHDRRKGECPSPEDWQSRIQGARRHLTDASPTEPRP